MLSNLLLTGLPKSGKSTLLENFISLVGDRKRGLLTREVLRNDERIGFDVVTSEPETARLARVDFASSLRVGKYGVDTSLFETVLRPLFNVKEGELLYVDEIGQMQLHSVEFGRLVQRYLDAPQLCIGTVSTVYEHSVISALRERKDTQIIEVKVENRERVFSIVKEVGERYLKGETVLEPITI